MYPVSTIEEGIELLTGVPAGDRQEDGTYPEETVFGRVIARLDEIQKTMKAAAKNDEEEEKGKPQGESDENEKEPDAATNGD